MAKRFLNNININDQYTFPSTDGSNGQAIITDGAGNLTFGSATAASAESSESVHISVKNTSGAQILKGTPVYVTGETGNSGKIEIAPADASDSAKMPALGLLESTLDNNAEGFCVQGGLLEALATATIDGTATTANDTVYVKSGGGLTMTKPTGSGLIQNIAKVSRVHASNGSLVVSSILRTNDVPNLTTGKIWVGDDNTVESTVVHLDEVNGRMGIDTANPTHKLHVHSDTDNDYVARFEGSTNNGAGVWTGIGIGGESNNTKSAIIFEDIGESYSRGKLHFAVNNSLNQNNATLADAKLTISNNGKVGIGTDSPTHKLDVNGGIKLNGASTLTDNAYFIGAPSHGFRWNSSDDAFNNVIMYDNGNMYVRGNVGIGTISPGAKLEVNGTIKAGIAGNSSANLPALLVTASGTGDEQASIAIQQATAEGDTIIFADYDPHVEWGISTENSNNKIQFTGGSSAGSLGSKTLYNNAGAARTAHIKLDHNLGTGDTSIGGNLSAANLSGTNTGDQDLSVYYTKTESDGRFVNVAGDTMTGDLILESNKIDFKTNGNSVLPNFLGHRSGIDLDTRFTTQEGGWSYTTFDSNSPNIPTSGLHNANGLLSFNTHGGDYGHQIAMTTNTQKIYFRSRNNTAWGNWYEFYHEGHKPTYSELGTMAYSNLTGTPTIPTDFVSAANGGTFSGDITAPSFIGKLMGGATGAPDATIWCVSGEYTDWGIFYDENTPDVIQFKSAGTSKATIALDNGDINSSGNISASNFSGTSSGTNTGDQTLASLGAAAAVHTHDASDIVSGTLNNSRLSGVFKSGSEIPGGQDLNNYRTTGYYAQDSNADAASGSNYPVNTAGILEVISGDQGNGLQTEQRYSRYNTNDKYVRHYYNGTWTSWAEVWNSSSDGSGSGLDADTLDGQHASAFLTSETDTLATVTARGASTSNAVSLLSADNAYNGHLYYNAFDANGNHYPHFRDGSNANGVNINWRLYSGSSLITHTWNYGDTNFVNSLRSTVDMRAPIFYDSNDTNYYLNPASASVLDELNVKREQRWFRDSSNNAHQRVDGRLDGSDQARLHWYGKDDSDATRNFKHAWYDGAQYINVTAENNAVSFVNTSPGYTTVSSDGDFRAPIFYDSDDTGYYVDPNSRSRFNEIQTADSGANPRYDTAFYVIQGQHWYGDTGSQVMFLGESGNPVRLRGRLRIGGTGDADSGMKLTVEGSSNATSSFRAPLFFDSDDTSYYVNPAGKSELNLVNTTLVNDAGSSYNAVTRVIAPDGGVASWDGGNVGAIKITLPWKAINIMWSMTVEIYNYGTNQSEEYTLGNYSYSNGGYHSSVTYKGAKDSTPKNVRFGNDGTKDCVWIGETSHAWSYPVVTLKDVSGGFRNATINNMTSGYDISIVTSFDTVQTNIEPALKSGYVEASYDMRAPRFYDLNNTGYYLDPASTSRYNSAQGNFLGIGTGAPAAGTGYRLSMAAGGIDMNNNSIDYVSKIQFNDNVRFYDNSDDSYLNFKYGDSIYGGIQFIGGDNTVRGTIFSDITNFGLLDHDGAWAVRTRTGTSPLMLYCDNNPEFYVYTSYTYSPGSSRAPVFYDHNNTAYYLDPSNTGISVKLAGHVECDSLYLNNASSLYFAPTYFGQRIKANCQGLLVQEGSTYYAVYASAFSVQSDYRLKSNIVPLDNAIDRLKQISVHRFNWNDKLNEPKVDGFIAHELSEVIPEAVLGEKDAIKEDGTPDYQGIDQSKIVPLLTAALQDAITKIEQLETRIQTLENNN